MAGREYRWTPHPGPQQVFLASAVPEVLYGGAKGGGKSDCLLYGALRQCDNPNYRALILRATFPQLRELIDRSLEAFSKIPGATYNQTEKRWKFAGGATIEFGFCETYQEAQQYTGQEFQYIGYDEIGNLKEERTWLSLMSCIRSTDPTLVKMARASANPGGVGHGWLKRRFISCCPPDGTPYRDPDTGLERAFVQAKVHDNPSITVNNPEYVAYLKSLPVVMRRQLLDGDWEAGSSLAFDRLTETSHVKVRTPESWWTYFGAFDWGFGHKWQFTLFANIGEHRVRVMDTTAGRRQTPRDIAEKVHELLKAYDMTFSDLQYTVSGYDKAIGDSGARGNFGPSIEEQFLAFGWPLMAGDPSRVKGYQNVLAYLEGDDPRLEFAPTPGLRAGITMLRELVVDPDSPNDVLKVDYDPGTGKDGDDFYDTLKMGLLSRPLNVAAPVNRLPTIDRWMTRQEQEKRHLQPANPRVWAVSVPRLTRSETIA